MTRYKTSHRPDGWWLVRCLQEGEIIGQIRNTGRRQWAALAQDGAILAVCATDKDHAIRMVEKYHGKETHV